jgi:hypothetical protein
MSRCLLFGHPAHAGRLGSVTAIGPWKCWGKFVLFVRSTLGTSRVRAKWPSGLIALAAGVALLLSGAPAVAYTDVVLSGVLMVDGAPLRGARVSATSGSFPTNYSTTLSDGSFSLSVPPGEATKLGIYDGYGLSVSTQAFTPSESASLGTVSLPTPSNSHYRVVDADGTPIWQATLERTSVLYLDSSNWLDHGAALNSPTAALPLYAAEGQWSTGYPEPVTTDADGLAVMRQPRLVDQTSVIDRARFKNFDADFAAATGSGTQADPRTLPLPGFQVQVPLAPFDVTVSQFSPSLAPSVTYTPGDVRGARISGYTVTASPGGKTVTFATNSVSDTSTRQSVSIPGLRDGSYSFTVVAHSAVGDSAVSSPSTPLKVVGNPDSTTGVTVRAVDPLTVEVAWAPVTTTSVTGYRVTLSNGSARVVSAGTTTATLNVSSGQTVTASVITLNQGWESAPVTSAPATVPNFAVPPPPPPPNYVGRVSKPFAKVKGRKVIVSWSAPSQGLQPITQYKVKRSTGRAVTVPGTRQRVVFKNLKPGIHKFAVVAYAGAVPSQLSFWVKARVR